MILRFFSLLNPYACPSHLSNYLLTWNTLLAADFFHFISLCIYRVCLRQYHRPVYRPADVLGTRLFPLGEDSLAEVEEFFTRIRFKSWDSTILAFPIVWKVISFFSPKVPQRDTAALSGRTLIGADSWYEQCYALHIWHISDKYIRDIYIYI